MMPTMTRFTEHLQIAQGFIPEPLIRLVVNVDLVPKTTPLTGWLLVELQFPDLPPPRRSHVIRVLRFVHRFYPISPLRTDFTWRRSPASLYFDDSDWSIVLRTVSETFSR